MFIFLLLLFCFHCQQLSSLHSLMQTLCGSMFVRPIYTKAPEDWIQLLSCSFFLFNGTSKLPGESVEHLLGVFGDTCVERTPLLSMIAAARLHAHIMMWSIVAFSSSSRNSSKSILNQSFRSLRLRASGIGFEDLFPKQANRMAICCFC